MAGTDMLRRLRSFFLSVWDFPTSAQSTLCQERNAMRENETTVWNWRRWKQIQKCEKLTHDGSAKVSGCSSWQNVLSLKASLFFSPFSLLAKVWFTSASKNGVTAACFHSPRFLMKRRQTAEHLSDIAGYVTCFSALNKTNDTVPACFLLLLLFYFIFFFPRSTCKDKEIIFREESVLVNLYCWMIRVNLFLFFPSLWNIRRQILVAQMELFLI